MLTDCRFCRLRLGADLGGGVEVVGRAGSKKGDVQMEKGGKTQTGESRHLVGELSSYLATGG